jgi:hypothetical protein
MRFHRAFSELAIPLGAKPQGEIASAETLTAVRFEPIVRAGKGAGLVDLHFRRDDRRTVVPFVIVDVAMLEARERDVLVWPQFASESGLVTDQIEDRLADWLADYAASDSLGIEGWHVFGDASDEAAFAAARAAGFLGAAPLEDVVRRAAPYVFARRHGRGRDVTIAARDAALGAAILAPVARRIRVVDGDPAALAWYAPLVTGDVIENDVVVVDADHGAVLGDQEPVTTIDLDDGPGLRVEPAPTVPVDVLFDFSAHVLRGERPFWVRAKKEPKTVAPLIPDAPATGGSAGRILFGLRTGALRFGGADVDLAMTIAQGLRDEGFTVDVIDDPSAARELAPDLIHAFGLVDPTAAAAYATAATTLEVPFALHALYDAAAFGGGWGATVAPYCYRFAHDEATVQNFLGMMRDRRLAVNEVRAEAPFHPNPRWESDSKAAVVRADVVFVTGEGEARAVRELAGVDSIVVPIPIPPAPEAAAVAGLVGEEPYVFVHGPIEASQNQLQAARAAQRADLPLVIAGPIVDGEYAALIRAFAGDRTIVVGEPEPALVEGLYRAAEVFLDVAWLGCGLARAIRAVSRGSALALSNRMHASDLGLAEFAQEVDPGDVESIARGLGDAWYLRREEGQRFAEARLDLAARSGVRQVTRALCGAYLGVLERRNQPAIR